MWGHLPWPAIYLYSPAADTSPPQSPHLQPPVQSNHFCKHLSVKSTLPHVVEKAPSRTRHSMWPLKSCAWLPLTQSSHVGTSASIWDLSFPLQAAPPKSES